MPYIKPERVKSYRVNHPRHGSQLVSLTNPPAGDAFARAVMKAAERWGVKWTSVASSCEVVQLSEAWRCTCGCGNTFISDTVELKCKKCQAKNSRPIDRYRYKRSDGRLTARN
jgi:hypothetical protein